MAGPLLLGVNLAGAEFGSNVPGTFGTDYTYPTHAEIDYYASKGMSVIWLPFLWERLQHAKNGALDSVELGRLDDVRRFVELRTRRRCVHRPCRRRTFVI